MDGKNETTDVLVRPDWLINEVIKWARGGFGTIPAPEATVVDIVVEFWFWNKLRGIILQIEIVGMQVDLLPIVLNYSLALDTQINAMFVTKDIDWLMTVSDRIEVMQYVPFFMTGEQRWRQTKYLADRKYASITNIVPCRGMIFASLAQTPASAEFLMPKPDVCLPDVRSLFLLYQQRFQQLDLPLDSLRVLEIIREKVLKMIDETAIRLNFPPIVLETYLRASAQILLLDLLPSSCRDQEIMATETEIAEKCRQYRAMIATSRIILACQEWETKGDIDRCQ